MKIKVILFAWITMFQFGYLPEAGSNNNVPVFTNIPGAPGIQYEPKPAPLSSNTPILKEDFVLPDINNYKTWQDARRELTKVRHKLEKENVARKKELEEEAGIPMLEHKVQVWKSTGLAGSYIVASAESKIKTIRNEIKQQMNYGKDALRIRRNKQYQKHLKGIISMLNDECKYKHESEACIKIKDRNIDCKGHSNSYNKSCDISLDYLLTLDRSEEDQLEIQIECLVEIEYKDSDTDAHKSDYLYERRSHTFYRYSTWYGTRRGTINFNAYSNKYNKNNFPKIFLAKCKITSINK